MVSLVIIMACKIANIVDPGEIQQKVAAVGKCHFYDTRDY